jgi:hypothetical protein
MSSVLSIDPPTGDRIASLERRVSDLESQSRSPRTLVAWLRSLLRWLATTPPMLVVLLIGLDYLARATTLSLGLVLLAVWVLATLLWAVVEVFAGGNFTFRLTRLILIVAMLAMILGYWQVAVREPYVTEQSCLASLKGLKGGVHSRPFGPDWLIGLIGKAPFQRVVQMELAGPAADERQIIRLRALPRLSCLFLSGPNFDDEMLDDLATLPGLDQVWLTDSRVTAAGVEQFRRARPSVQIERQGTTVDGPPPNTVRNPKRWDWCPIRQLAPARKITPIWASRALLWSRRGQQTRRRSRMESSPAERSSCHQEIEPLQDRPGYHPPGRKTSRSGAARGPAR